MLDTIQSNWVVFAAVLVLALLGAWWLFGRAAAPRERSYRPDVLDEGVGPAQRNQALIDAAPAVQIVQPPLAADALGGMGEVVAMAAQAEVAELSAETAQGDPEVPQPADPEPAPELPPQADPAPELPGESPQESPAAPQIAPDPAPAANDTGDDLSRIKGLGPKLQALLPTLGLTTYAQIAALDDAALDELDGKLGAFAGRPVKDNWVAQAKHLAAGDVAGFEAQFGKI